MFVFHFRKCFFGQPTWRGCTTFLQRHDSRPVNLYRGRSLSNCYGTFAKIRNSLAAILRQRVLADPDRFQPGYDQVLRRFEQWDGQARSLRRVVTRCKPREVELSVGLLRNDSPHLIVRLENIRRGTSQRFNDSAVSQLLSAGVVNTIKVGTTGFRPRNRHLVLAVHDETLNKYVGQPQARPGDRILLLLHIHRVNAWLSCANQVARADTIRKFQSETRDEEPTWFLLRDLPNDWCLIRLLVRRDLGNIPDPWATIISRTAFQMSPCWGAQILPP